MSDEWITVEEQVVAEAVAPFVEMVGDAVEAATAVLEALREAGFDVYRPDECALLDYWQDTPDDKVALVDDELRERVARALHDSDPVSSPRTREDWDIHRAWYYSQADAVLRVVAEHLGGRDV